MMIIDVFNWTDANQIYYQKYLFGMIFLRNVKTDCVSQWLTSYTCGNKTKNTWK